jgi:hypothetical protein
MTIIGIMNKLPHSARFVCKIKGKVIPVQAVEVRLGCDFIYRPVFLRTLKKHNISETGSVCVLRRGVVDTNSIGSR